MSYYPAGTENDPRAPWNAPDYIPVCDACGYEGAQEVGETCEECEDGTIREPND